jgi:hypothetical protein
MSLARCPALELITGVEKTARMDPRGTEATGIDGPWEAGKQDKRERHVRVAKALSAHRFWRHVAFRARATSMPTC